MTMLKRLLLVLPILLLTACWNGENVHVRFGDVSIGQQLIDLKAALERGAISEEQFDKTRTSLLAISTLCGDDEDEDSWL